MKIQSRWFIFTIIYSLQLFCMHPDEAIKINPALKEQIEQVKKKNILRIQFQGQQIEKHLQNPTKKELKVVNEILRECNIQQKDLVVFRGYAKEHGKLISENNPDQFYLVIPDTKKISEGIIYHELGHFVNQDYSRHRLQIRYAQLGTAIGSFIYGKIGFSVCQSLSPAMQWTVAGACGILGAYNCDIIAKLVIMYNRRNCERNADLFMYDHLLRQKKQAAVIEIISSNLDSYAQITEEPNQDSKDGIARIRINGSVNKGLLSAYPTEFERAKIGIDQLKKYGHSLESIIVNLPEDLDDKVKKQFPGQIRKWFPEEFEKKKL